MSKKLVCQYSGGENTWMVPDGAQASWENLGSDGGGRYVLLRNEAGELLASLPAGMGFYFVFEDLREATRNEGKKDWIDE